MLRLPQFIAKYFWGDNPKELSLSKHRQYISKIILEKGNVKATKWLLKKQSKKQLKKSISSKMDKKSRNFWSLYFS